MKNVRVVGKLRQYALVLGLVCFYLVVTLLKSTGLLTSYYEQVIMFAMMNSMVTLGLNLVNGFTGQFSIGQAGFVAVGGYVSATITRLLLPSTSIPEFLQIPVFLLALLIGGSTAGIIGYLIALPSLRLRGDYLAIVTLAFGEVLRSIIRIVPQVGGPRGLSGIPRYSNLFWVTLFFGLTVWVCRNLVFSAHGRACISCRENEIAAETLGIDTTKYKVSSFTIAAFIAGVAGGLFGHLLMYLHPDSFSYLRSTDFLVYLYAGGVGSLTGSVIGATILTVVPELLRFLSNWRLVIYGVVLVFLMLFRPTGLCGNWEVPGLVPKISGPGLSGEVKRDA